MKMGEIRWGGNSNTFYMQTPDGVGIRPVTLRCDVDGVVHVEEISEGKSATRSLKITQMRIAPKNSIDDIAQQVAAVQKRLRSKEGI